MITSNTRARVMEYARHHSPCQVIWADALQAAPTRIKRIAIKRVFLGQPWPSTN
jgi:hypothetical protein